MKTERCTVYFRGGILGNIVRLECRSAEARLRAYAQFSSAVEFRYTQKGCRKARGSVQTDSPSVLILEGWGHPEPAPIFEPANEQEGVDGSTFTKATHSGFSPGWQADFDAMIDAHIETTGATVAADFRGHDPHEPLEAAS